MALLAACILLALVACSGSDTGIGMPRCSAWIILHGAADLRLDCPSPPQKPAAPKPAPTGRDPKQR
jgi:hypothetical protein